MRAPARRRGARTALAIGLVTWVALSGAARVFATTSALTPAEVVKSGARLDGTSVTVEGEAIGDALRADSTHVWVNVLGGETAIGLYVPRAAAEAIRVWGDWARTGDSVRAVGTFHAACDAHGGDTDIHAVSIAVVGAGSTRPHGASVEKAAVGLGLCGLSGALLWFYLRRRRRRPY